MSFLAFLAPLLKSAFVQKVAIDAAVTLIDKVSQQTSNTLDDKAVAVAKVIQAAHSETHPRKQPLELDPTDAKAVLENVVKATVQDVAQQAAESIAEKLLKDDPEEKPSKPLHRKRKHR